MLIGQLASLLGAPFYVHFQFLTNRYDILTLDSKLHATSLPLLRWSTVDAEIKVPSTENPELLKVFYLKPAVSQNIDLRVSPVARNHTCLISAFPVVSAVFPNPLQTQITLW